MRSEVFSVVLVVAMLLSGSADGFAFETDQFNLPPVPLADIGDEVSEYVEGKIAEAVGAVNAQIDMSARCLTARTKRCGTREDEQARLDQLRSKDAIVKEVFKRLGDGNIFRTKFGKWVNSYDFHAEPARFKTGYFDSIYLTAPANYFTISPTINMYGTEFGTDKLEHMFQQGYRYYEIEKQQIAKGAGDDEAIRKAVEWGKKSERTYYGLLVSGVYSNADLFANYAGMRFFDGLTRDLQLGDTTRAAILVQTNGKWQINEPETIRERLLRPFISDHLNEAFNPSGFAFTLYSSVRHIVRKRACRDWHARFPELTADELDRKAADLELWHDEDYGNMPKGRLLRLSEVCFGKERSN